MRVNWQDSGAGEFADMESFRKEFPAAEVLTVDGAAFHGECAKCSRLILGKDRYREYELGEMLCEDCCQ